MPSARALIASIISTASDMYDLEEVLDRPSFLERLREIDEDMSCLFDDADEN